MTDRTSGQIHSTVGGFVICVLLAVLQAKLFGWMVLGWCRLSHSMPLFSPALQVPLTQVERDVKNESPSLQVDPLIHGS